MLGLSKFQIPMTMNPNIFATELKSASHINERISLLFSNNFTALGSPGTWRESLPPDRACHFPFSLTSGRARMMMDELGREVILPRALLLGGTAGPGSLCKVPSLTLMWHC